MVVGAGSAGCVVASRLSEDGSKVVLLEAGPPDRHPMIHIPAGILSLLYNPKVNWCYSTEPQAGSGQRRIHWPRGRVLGGSSSINGMLYVRGNAADYDNWAQRGCRGWSYDDEWYEGYGDDSNTHAAQTNTPGAPTQDWRTASRRRLGRRKRKALTPQRWLFPVWLEVAFRARLTSSFWLSLFFAS